MTGWAMLGLEAAGVNPRDVGRRGRSPVAYLRRNVDEVRSPGDLARTILALNGAGVEPAQLRRPRPGGRRWQPAGAPTAPTRAGRTRPPSR